MWIVLASEADSAAQWAARGLIARGLAPLEWIPIEVLPDADWDHRLGGSDPTLEFLLPDGRLIRSDRVRGVLNRVTCVPSEHVLRAHPADRVYTLQELTAFYLSWLNAWPCPIVNSPRPNALCGSGCHPSEWCCLAARADLHCAPYRQTSRDPWHAQWQPGAFVPQELASEPRSIIFVVGSEVIVPPDQLRPPDEVCIGAPKLARLAGAALLGLEFVADYMVPWTLVSADSLPDLRRGGNALLDALARVLASPARTAGESTP